MPRDLDDNQIKFLAMTLSEDRKYQVQAFKVEVNGKGNKSS